MPVASKKKPVAKKATVKKEKPKATVKAVAPKEPKAETKVAAAPRANKSNFTIRKDIPIPARTHSGGGVSSYPFPDMEVNDSFGVPVEVDAAFYADDNEFRAAKREEAKKISARLSSAIRRYSKAHAGQKFSMRVIGDEVSVWRVA